MDKVKTKKLLFNEEALNKLEEGARAVSEAVSVTMGPKGNLAMFQENFKIPYPAVTKDGCNTVSLISFKDEAKNNGAQIQAARKQVLETGDGTTLCSILTYKLFKEGRKLITAGYHQNKIIKGMREAVADIVKIINKNANKNVDLKALKKISRVASNHDDDLADKIAEAVHKTGKYGVVFHSKSRKDEHSLEFQDGYQVESGIEAAQFSNVRDVDGKNAFLLKMAKPYIIVTEKTIVSPSSLNKLLSRIFDETPPEKKPLIVLFAPQVSSEMLQVMLKNITEPDGEMFMVYIAPSQDLAEEKNRMIMEDLAAITGATFISDDCGIQIKDMGLEHVGTCDFLSSNPGKTLIKGYAKTVKNRIKELNNRLKVVGDNELTRKYIEESLARLTDGVAVIKVGGRNFTEQAETIDKVEDAILSCKAAKDGGFVRGGGVAMLEAYYELKKLVKDDDIGYKAVLESLKYPAEIILTNAKVDNWQSIISEIAYYGAKGYDIKLGKICEDMLKLDIIDPAKVITYALKNAVAAAISMLRTSVMLIEDKDE